MARGTQLAELRMMLMAEIGDNQTPNNLRRKEMDMLLSNEQKFLATEFEWPFLQHQWDVGCPPNTQYVTLPTVDVRGVTAEIDWERPVLARRFWSQIYEEIEYGIGTNEYNWQNYALGQGNDPIQRWQIVSNTKDLENPNQIEVWPVPVGVTQYIRFNGQRMIQQMVADTDRADLDDMMLVLFVAAGMLTRKKQADAESKMMKAKQRLSRITRMYPARQQCLVLGQPIDYEKKRNLLPVIAIAGSAGGVEDMQEVYYYTGTDPNTDGVVPEDIDSPAIAYKQGGAGPMYTWNVTTHLWE